MLLLASHENLAHLVEAANDKPDANVEEEEDERDDEVFPLPAKQGSQRDRTLARSRVSVKDLSKTFEQQIEQTGVEAEKSKNFQQRRYQEKVTDT